MPKYTLASMELEINVDASFPNIKKMNMYGINVALQLDEGIFPLYIDFEEYTPHLDYWDGEKTIVILKGSGNLKDLIIDSEEHKVFQVEQLPKILSIEDSFLEFVTKSGVCRHSIDNIKLSFKIDGGILDVVEGVIDVVSDVYDVSYTTDK